MSDEFDLSLSTSSTSGTSSSYRYGTLCQFFNVKKSSVKFLMEIHLRKSRRD